MSDFSDGFKRDMNEVIQQQRRGLVGGFAGMVRDLLVRPAIGVVQGAEGAAKRGVAEGMNGVRRESGLPEQQLPRGGTPGHFPAERGGYSERPLPMGDAQIRVKDGRISIERGGGYAERPLPTGDSQIRVGDRVYTEGGRPQVAQKTLGQAMANQTPEQKRQSAIALGLGDRDYSNLIDQQRNHEERTARGLPAARTSPLERAAQTERANFARSGTDAESWENLKFVENDFQNRLQSGQNVAGQSPMQQVLSVDTTQPAFQRPRANMGTTMAAAAPAQPLPVQAAAPAQASAQVTVAAAQPISPTAQQLTEQGGLKASDYTTMRGGGDGVVSTAPAAAPAATAPAAASGDAPAGLKNVDAYQRWKQQNPGLSQ